MPSSETRSAIRYSIVIPSFNEAESLPELCDRIQKTFSGLGQSDAFEVLVVDDGSTDDTRAVVDHLAIDRPWLRRLSLRRNCGKSLALMAGFRATRGSVICTLDADLQDRPEDLPALLDKLDQGYDMVSGWRQTRQDEKVRIAGSGLFNWTVAKTTGLVLHDINCGIKAYRVAVTRRLRLYGQYHRYIPVMAHMLGFRVSEVRVGNDARKYGASKFRAIRYQGLFDLMSILFLHKYGLNPLHFFGVISAVIALPSVGILAVLGTEHLFYLLGFGTHYALPNRPIFIISLISLLLSGLVFFSGFICDFFLRHMAPGTVAEFIDDVLVSPDEEAEATIAVGRRTLP